MNIHENDVSLASNSAVVGSTAGPAMAVPLVWSKLVLAGPLFRPIMIFFYFCRVIVSADQSLSIKIGN